jgi:hypothetical protein
MQTKEIDIIEAAMHGRTLLALQEKERGLVIEQQEPIAIPEPYDETQRKINKVINRLPKGIDIVQEFELIQQKKSKLSRWQRDMIERIFNSIYKKADQ